MFIGLARRLAILIALFFVSAAHGQEDETVSSISFNLGSQSVKLDNSLSRGVHFDITTTLQKITPSGVMYGIDLINGYTSAHWKDDGSISYISLEVRPILTLAAMPHIGFALTQDTMAFVSIGSQLTVLDFDVRVRGGSYGDIDFVNSLVIGGGVIIKDINLFGDDTTDGRYMVRFDYRFTSKERSNFYVLGVRIPYEYGDSHLFTLGIGWRVK